jgi:hypothetical protein
MNKRECIKGLELIKETLTKRWETERTSIFMCFEIDRLVVRNLISKDTGIELKSLLRQYMEGSNNFAIFTAKKAGRLDETLGSYQSLLLFKQQNKSARFVNYARLQFVNMLIAELSNKDWRFVP